MDQIILAECGFGDIFLCGRCSHIHLRCRNFSTSFSIEAFQELKEMVIQATKSLSAKPAWGKEMPCEKVNLLN